MDLKTFTADLDRRQKLASALGKSPMYLWQLANGWADRKPSPALARDIEAKTKALGHMVPKESLRPDVWTDETPVRRRKVG